MRGSADPLAAGVGAGIAARGHHHGQGVVVGEVHPRLAELARGAGEAGVEQLGAEAHGEHLRLGVAEAHVVLDEARPAVRDHEPGVEDALVGGAAAGHLGEGRADDALDRGARSPRG